jgi:hypothetical protein
MKVSSTWTTVLSLLAHARSELVKHDPRRLALKSPSRLSARAEKPFFADAITQAVMNQVVSGVRVRWKIVPAVTEVPAHVPPIPRSPSPSYRVAYLAYEPMRPPQPIQVVEAFRVPEKPCVEVNSVLGVILARHKERHVLNLPPRRYDDVPVQRTTYYCSINDLSHSPDGGTWGPRA